MPTHRSRPVDGFRLTYDTEGDGPPVVLLHGWPGARSDYRALRPLLAPHARLLVPDLRGFGESDKHDADPGEYYSAAAQARSVAALLTENDAAPAVLVGYDVGSRVAQALARERPELVHALVLSPPLPGVGDRVLDADAQREFWYQSFHRLDLVERLLDGRPDAVREYLAYFWQHWSGPDYRPSENELNALVEQYSPPGAFRASIAWYRAGAGTVRTALAERAPAPDERISLPTTVLWPDHDPLFPRAWSDRIEEFFAQVTVRPVNGVGHYAPLEYPRALADAVLDHLATPA